MSERFKLKLLIVAILAAATDLVFAQSPPPARMISPSR